MCYILYLIKFKSQNSIVILLYLPDKTIPMYKIHLLNTFMAGVKNDDNLIWASSLSNLADVCRFLHYNLGSIMAEIIKCADYVFSITIW